MRISSLIAIRAVVLLVWPVLYASELPVTVLGSTATQIMIRYRPPSPDACTISLTDNNGGPNPPRDLDPNLFPGANSDTSRTVANGFRWPALAQEQDRIVVLGGHDEIKKAADGRWYSTALQADSEHIIRVSCNSGSDTGTISYSTANVPVGSYYPELPIPTPGSPMGGVPQPTIDWNDRTQSIIDPISGVLIKPFGFPLDNIDGTPSSAARFVRAFDLNAAWTNPSNAITNQNSGGLASTSTSNAPLFLAWGDISPGCCAVDISDVQVILYGNSELGSEIAEVCITEDGGQTCASQPIDVTFSAGTAKIQDSIPSAANHAVHANHPFPSNYFGGWGVWNLSYGIYDLTNLTYNGVNATGNTVTMPGMVNAGFNVDRPAGTPFTLTGCAAGGDVTLHVSRIPTNIEITTQEKDLKHSGCTYTEWSSGVRVVLKNSGTLRVSATYKIQTGFADSGGSHGNTYYCFPEKVHDITKDCDGNTRSPAASGYMCQFSNGVYLLQDDGRICLQANYFTTVSQGAGISRKFFRVPDPFVSNTSLLKEDSGTARDIYLATLNNGGDYTEFHPAADHTAADKFTYTNLSAKAIPVSKQVIASGSVLGRALATGLWKNGLNIAATSLGYVMYSVFAGGDSSLCAYAATDSNLSLIHSWTVWDKYPVRWGGCHSSPVILGNYAHVQAGNVAAHFSPGILLGGPFVSGITALIKNGSVQQYTIPISWATATNPVVLTSNNNDISGFVNVSQGTGAYMTCQGGTGSWAIINRSLYAKKIDNNTFALYTDAALSKSIDGTGLAGLSGSPTCSMAPALYNIRVTAVGSDGAGNARVSVALDDPGYTQKFPDQRVVIQDGDPINFQRLSQNTQYYAKVSCVGCARNEFDVYKDAALTTHAAPAEIAGAEASKGTVAYAETCPDSSEIRLPGPQYFDSGFGEPGAPKVRCTTFRLNMEPCSWWASSGEGSSYPCPSDPANSSKSSLQNLAVGDGLYMVDQGPTNAGEIFYILAIKKAGETQLDVTVERWYGDSPDYNQSRNQNNYIYNHPYGGQVLPFPVVNSAWIDFTAGGAWVPESPIISAAHHDVSLGSKPGNIILSAGYERGTFDDLVDVPITRLSEPVSYSHSNFPIWARNNIDTAGSISSALQSYPNNRHIYDQTPQSQNFALKSDWMAVNPGFGSGQNAASGVFQTPQPPLKIRGTSFDAAGNTNLVYKLSNASTSGKLNIKLIPTMVHASPHTYFVDMSGPNSLITDSDVGRMCQVYVAGECRPNSSPGDVFVALTGYWNTGNTWCISNAATLSTPCLFPLWPGAGWAVQIAQTPVDLDGSSVRRLTMGFTLPMSHLSFQNWTTSPDGRWGFFASSPVQYRPGWQTLGGVRFYAMKLPRWPASESKDRGRRGPSVTDRGRNFVNIRIAASGSGDTVRVAFGYAENGDPAKLYCTTRAETCWTAASPSASDPFLFSSEGRSTMPCGETCSVTIPAIAGRIVYYRVEHSDGSVERLQAIAVP